MIPDPSKIPAQSSQPSHPSLPAQPASSASRPRLHSLWHSLDCKQIVRGPRSGIFDSVPRSQIRYIASYKPKRFQEVSRAPQDVFQTSLRGFPDFFKTLLDVCLGSFAGLMRLTALYRSSRVVFRVCRPGWSLNTLVDVKIPTQLRRNIIQNL